MKYNNESRLEKKRQKTQLFIDTLNEWKSNSEIISLYEEGYTPLQVVKLWLYYTNSEIRKRKLELNGKNFAPYEVLRDTGLSIQLKSHIPYTKEQHELHLSKSQAWKISCNYLDKSPDEINSIVEKQLKNWATNTHEQRRKGSVYNKDNTPEYWVEKLGLTYNDALEKVRQHKRIKSPFSVGHWINKGFSKEEAISKARICHIRGGIAATKACGTICASKIEKQLYADLLEIFPNLEEQYCINGTYVYDICAPKLKKIIEFNGTYWHADPRIYAPDALVHYVPAKNIWKRDKKKIGYAKHKEYDVLVVWELDFYKSRENTLELIKEFLQEA
jgi:hypothetical protein